MNTARYVFRRLYGMDTGREGKREGREARVDLLGMALATPDYVGYSLL